MTRLTFLGTGGGRFVTLTQERSTGGIYLEDDYRVHIDPGPGALHALKRNRIDPTMTGGIMISHCHPDHYANAEILMEGIHGGRGDRRGFLIAAHSVTMGRNKVGPAVSRYHQDKMATVLTVSPGDHFQIGKLKGSATPSFHSDPDTVGFRFDSGDGVVSYIADTELREGLIEPHEGARVLILATTRPLMARIPFHLSTEDAAEIAEIIRPDVVFLTHMGKKFIKEGPRRQARWVEERSGVRTIAAEDDMKVLIRRDIEVISRRRNRRFKIRPFNSSDRKEKASVEEPDG
ncbi:MAG: MBL fold metallo-hydrolase [Candidatus Thermoplasmatota archaeon]|nr:MBL fold metallo-hydrolase [Candidatus Thermoplasmatota archaeon]